MKFQDTVRLHYDSLNETEKDMISTLMEHLDDYCALSITDLGKMLRSSRSSVLRMAQKLGYRGYSEMKYEMQLAVNTREVIPSNLAEEYRHDVMRTFELANSVNFLPLIEKMERCRNLILYATGFVQNNYTKQLGSELFLYGRPNHLISGETNFDIISKTLGPEDLVIIVSLSGNTPGVIPIVNMLNIRKVPVCSVTRVSENALLRSSQYHLFYECSNLPVEKGTEMNTLSIILSLLSLKYLEHVLYDEV